MKAYLLIVFAAQSVVSSQNLEGNKTIKGSLRPQSPKQTTVNDLVISRPPRSFLQLNQGWPSPPIWIPSGRNDLVFTPPIPSMIGYPPLPAPPTLIPAPPPFFIPPNAAPFGIVNPYEAMGIPAMGLMPSIPQGSGPSLLPTGALVPPFSGMLVPIATTVTVQTEEVGEAT